jgi:hypothetical protein
MVLEDGRKVCEVADQPVLSPDTLKNRLRAARAGKTFPAQHGDVKDLELERLRHAVRTLCMECGILKKPQRILPGERCELRCNRLNAFRLSPSQYCSKAYQQQLAAYRMQCSMSRKGNSHDNAPMKSFRGLLKNGLVYRTRFRSRRLAKTAIMEYLEIFYNRQRIQAGHGYQPPAAFAKNFRRGKTALAA